MNFILTLIMLTNSVHVQPVKVDPILVKRAEVRAKYLCDKNQWSHDGWLDSFKGLNGVFGENLAKDYDSATSTFQAWLNSPTHKANLVNLHFTKIGIARYATSTCNRTVELFQG